MRSECGLDAVWGSDSGSASCMGSGVEVDIVD